MKYLLKNAFRRFGFDVVRYPPKVRSELDTLSDFSDAEKQIISTARPFTMTSVERMAALMNAVTHIAEKRIPGDIVECGVWRGGSMMTIALTLLARGEATRSLYLYDTFEGMSSPTSVDRRVDGVSADDLLRLDPSGTRCYASLDDVMANVISTGYPVEKLHFIKGKVEETIPASLPPGLAILRLDTDWYESTKHELTHLYPLLHANGILIIDDYGHWQGARKAVDEYFHEKGSAVYLHRIDETGRIVVRTDTQS